MPSSAWAQQGAGDFPRRTKSAYEYAAEMSPGDAHEVLNREVERLANRRAGYPVSDDPIVKAALAVAAVTPEQVLERANAERERRLVKLRGEAAPLADREAEVTRARAAYRAAHAACTTKERRRANLGCTEECRLAYGRVQVAVDAATPARRAAGEVKRLSTPLDVRRTEAAARRRLLEIRSRLYEVRSAIANEEVRASVGHSSDPRPGRRLAVLAAEREQIAAELVEAEREHGAAVAAREGVERAALATPSPTEQPKRKAKVSA